MMKMYDGVKDQFPSIQVKTVSCTDTMNPVEGPNLLPQFTSGWHSEWRTPLKWGCEVDDLACAPLQCQPIQQEHWCYLHQKSPRNSGPSGYTHLTTQVSPETPFLCLVLFSTHFRMEFMSLHRVGKHFGLHPLHERRKGRHYRDLVEKFLQ